MKMASASAAVPEEFLCPITRELMKDPVIAAGMSSLKSFILVNVI